jgi:hypothetical protein
VGLSLRYLGAFDTTLTPPRRTARAGGARERAATTWISEVLSYVCPFAVDGWFESRQDAKVFVSAYRVYGVPLRNKPVVATFGQVRAVFIRWNAPYQKIDQNVVEPTRGQIGAEVRPILHRTGEGVVLLLMAPLPGDYDGNDQDAARERVGFIRSFMVSLIGRNAAYEHEFDMTVECGERVVANPSGVFVTPADETPAVNADGMEMVRKALENLSSFDDEKQTRIRLALRWYQRSFGDDRVVRDTVQGQVDDFVNCWLALETLAMEGTTDIGPIKRMLADIHRLDAQKIGELFPIGRIYGLRGKILHEGQISNLKDGLTGFMTDVFSDLLLHVLGLPSGENTRKYLDGSANGLI